MKDRRAYPRERSSMPRPTIMSTHSLDHIQQPGRPRDAEGAQKLPARQNRSPSDHLPPDDTHPDTQATENVSHITPSHRRTNGRTPPSRRLPPPPDSVPPRLLDARVECHERAG